MSAEHDLKVSEESKGVSEIIASRAGRAREEIIIELLVKIEQNTRK